ncbi:MAG: hypothetical protein GX685_05900 [Clostridiales bacterium]|nr:hypothetical protein [Clostridiales bacterium]
MSKWSGRLRRTGPVVMVDEGTRSEGAAGSSQADPTERVEQSAGKGKGFRKERRLWQKK